MSTWFDLSFFDTYTLPIPVPLWYESSFYFGCFANWFFFFVYMVNLHSVLLSCPSAYCYYTLLFMQNRLCRSFMFYPGFTAFSVFLVHWRDWLIVPFEASTTRWAKKLFNYLVIPLYFLLPFLFFPAIRLGHLPFASFVVPAGMLEASTASPTHRTLPSVHLSLPSV